MILAAVVAAYLSHPGRQNSAADPYSAITGDACIVIETVDLLSFMNSVTAENSIFGEAGRVSEFSTFTSKLRYLTDNLNKAELRDIASGGHAVISFFPVHGGSLDILISMSVPENSNIRKLRQVLGSAGIKNTIEIRKGRLSLLAIPYSKSADTVFIALNSELLLAGNSVKMVSEGLDALESGIDVRSSPGFSRVLLASGNNADKIFLVFKNLPEVLSPMLSSDIRNSSSTFADLAASGGGDIYLNDGGLVLSGYTESNDKSDILYRYKFTKSSEFETYRILPEGTALFETLILQSPDSGKIDTTSAFPVGIRQFAGNELTRAYIDIRDNDVQQNNLVIVELTNPVQAELAISARFSDSLNIRWFQPDDQVRFPVYHLPSTGLIKTLFPSYTGNYSDSLVAFYDKYLIAGSSYRTITRLLYDNLLNNTLANDLVYRDFESSLPSRSSYYFYCVPYRIIGYLNGFLSDNLIAGLQGNKGSLNKIQAAGYQLTASNGMLYNSLSIRFKDEVRQESVTEWETLLDTTAGIKPFFFTNHITGAREIFVQDLKNNIYLINTAGRVLWKVPLGEKIEGTIYMIDYFRNGKYQLLFNGKNHLHLIDRNGNYVERYPVKLRSPATNSLALFDYDNNRNYRLLIAGEDRMLYAYDRTGSVVKGWKPFRTAGTVRTQMSYFRVSGKDYLAASDESSLYILDRYGNSRVTFREPVSRAAGSVLKLKDGSEAYLVCSSNEGIIQHIYLDGSVKKFDVGKFSSNHFLDVFDIDNDGFDEFIFIDNGNLYLYDHNRTELFTRNLESEKLSGPITFSFSPEDKKIGIFDEAKNLIYLLDKDGEIVEGFPLKGASMFSIGRLSEKDAWHLIVGGPGKFLYNYKIGSGT